MENQKNLEVLKFGKNNLPIAYESKETSDNKYVTYGYNNLYPNFLLSLYNDSPIHAAIINAKTTYIIGDGLKYGNGQDLSFKVNAADNVKEFVDKLIKDYLIFNAFAVEVIFNRFGDPIEYHHVPFQNIRVNKSKTKFWYNEDWVNSRKTITYDRYTPKQSDTTSKIFYFDGYFPSVNNVYSQPEYNGAIRSIVTDIAIREFNLNNIKNHFSVSSIITFFQGSNLSEEIKAKVIADLTASYMGENGKKVIVDFQSPEGKSAEVHQLSANDWDKAYVEVTKKNMEDIMIGHQVTSPMLMGVKTEGQLGGATELQTAYEIFKATYVRVKRDELENALNQLFEGNKEITGKIVFADKPLFNTNLSESMKEKVMTINEIRQEAGMEKVENGDRLLSEPIPANLNKEASQKMIDSINSLSPLVANNVLQQMTINEVRALAGLPPVDGGDRLANGVQPSEASAPANPVPVQQEDEKKNSVVKRKLSEEDYEQVKDLGAAYEDFDVLGEWTEQQSLQFDKEADVSQYVIKNDIKDLTLKQLSDLLKKDAGITVSVGELQGILNRLHTSGVVKVDITDGKVKVEPSTKADVPDTGSVLVLYQYVKRPDVDGGDLLPTSRSFCVKLIKNNRLYKMEEIQKMSALFGYDVFRYAGGFYFNPDTEETTPYCRHGWKALQVRKRSENPG